MRDIERRLGRYRLSRYAPPVDPVRRSLKWAWWLGALWLLWIGVISDHSLLRISRLSSTYAASQRRLADERRQADQIAATLRNPDELVEQTARRNYRMAKPGERIYIISGDHPAAKQP
jgi:hypothetical protein